MVRADERLEKGFSSLTLPVLILHGTHDKATKPSGSQQFLDTVGSVDKTLKLYEGGYHDLLNDTDRDQVMADVTSWVDRQIAQRQTSVRAADLPTARHAQSEEVTPPA
jgi:alpha-beta hydrolase superfamily lysophospholipase